MGFLLPAAVRPARCGATGTAGSCTPGVCGWCSCGMSRTASTRSPTGSVSSRTQHSIPHGTVRCWRWSPSARGIITIIMRFRETTDMGSDAGIWTLPSGGFGPGSAWAWFGM
ncbi:hypothetical protein BO82DRAFT_419033 [Aspergillus uvarum CBS 121591]|uniref:Uncharacterized protein n=1 Tax=Aspergillus uvarum CBS 121591 TaxID=1448315 RepID=A0A319C867_9EURO|nr:hypothetical protein BO82DRAFT_419033 [Aspergillus uvarum CBS 121591]PYH80089.1 hypothetical protein BO82DRAFT_419033 [Aspergillus uvarum CBS 121591]